MLVKMNTSHVETADLEFLLLWSCSCAVMEIQQHDGVHHSSESSLNLILVGEKFI